MAEWMTIEIAELIERGLELTRRQGGAASPAREKPNTLLELDGSMVHASPLGLALIGRAGDPRVAASRWLQAIQRYPGNRVEAAAYSLGIPIMLATLIELNHRHGADARAIAQKLRAGTLGMLQAQRSW